MASLQQSRSLPQSLQIEDKPQYREVSQSERLNLCEDYLFLDDDEIYYTEQRESLRQKYRELDRELSNRIKRIKASKERLRNAVRYCLITVQAPEGDRASRPTSLLSPSQELRDLTAVEVRN